MNARLFYHVHGRLQEVFSETCAHSGTLFQAVSGLSPFLDIAWARTFT